MIRLAGEQERPTTATTTTTNTHTAPASYVHVHRFRVRYSETDQLGTFYNSRALEWFEVGRTELMRTAGVPYADVERRGIYLPLVEALVKYHGRARYDDLLEMTSVLWAPGKASLRFDVRIAHAESGATPVAAGHTLHAVTDASGKVTRCPRWLAVWERTAG